MKQKPPPGPFAFGIDLLAGDLEEPSPEAVRAVAAFIGAKGGAAGRGPAKRTRTTFTSKLAKRIAKRRPPESQRRDVDYAALGRKGAAARLAKKKGEGG